MNKYIDSIEALFCTKKENSKKEPSSAEKSEFMTSWINLVKENGFAGKTEQFLYQGFSFCGAEPFYQFLKQSPDQNSTLKQIFSGQQYGKDSDVTFRLITHLLSLMLNDEAPSNILSPVIEHFPLACRNKKGKRLGTATKTMEKYFLNVLSPDVVLRPLTEINLDQEEVNSFVAVLSFLIEELKKTDSLKEPVISNIGKIEEWARNYLETTDSVGKYDNNAREENQKAAKTDSGMQVVGHPRVSADHEKKETVQLDSLQEVLIHAQTLANRLTIEIGEQKQRIAGLETINHDNSLRLMEASQKLEDQRNTITDLNRKNYELDNQCRTLQHALDEKEKLLKEKDVEIAERIKMSEVLSRDRSRQADENLQRIASKIKVEYRDFMDALDTPMTVDLGENLRLQLMSIFEILEKGGMKID